MLIIKHKHLLGLFVILFVISFSGCAGAQKKPDAKLKSVNNEVSYCYTGDEGGSITKINADTNKVAKTISLDGAVYNVQIAPNGDILGATFIPDEDIDHLGEPVHGYALFYSTKDDRLLKKVSVGRQPAHIDFTHDGEYALVTNNADNTVTVVKTKNFEVEKTISVGKGPLGLRIDKQDKYAYIANMGEDSVSVLALDKLVQVEKIRIGKQPTTTGITRDNRYLVAPLNAENMVALVSLKQQKATVAEAVYKETAKEEDKREVIKIKVGSGPAQIFVEPNGKFAYVANQGTEEQPSNTVNKIDLRTKKVVATIKVGKGAHGVVTSPDGKLLYVTNLYEGTVSVVDTDKDFVVETIKVGYTPNGITFKP